MKKETKCSLNFVSYHCEGGKVTVPLQGLGKHPQDCFGGQGLQAASWRAKPREMWGQTVNCWEGDVSSVHETKCSECGSLLENPGDNGNNQDVCGSRPGAQHEELGGAARARTQLGIRRIRIGIRIMWGSCWDQVPSAPQGAGPGKGRGGSLSSTPDSCLFLNTGCISQRLYSGLYSLAEVSAVSLL